MINLSMRQIKAVVFSVGLAFMGPAQAQMPNSSSDNARVYFIQPADGQVFDGQDEAGIEIIFGLTGMQVSPAGIAVPNSGHHHLLINVEHLPDLTSPLPATDQVRHFGKGQTSTRVKLSVGKHRLQLIVGNQVHIPHSPPVMSEVIEIEVR
tara:strand:+ start:292 stop:744 length:453 start_codon:yes stop_codon:yes gene_type:complete